MKVPYQLYRDPLPSIKPKYPFAQMEPGDCFYLPNRFGIQSAVTAAVGKWIKRSGKDWKFVTRKVGDQIGVWRVA